MLGWLIKVQVGHGVPAMKALSDSVKLVDQDVAVVYIYE